MRHVYVNIVRWVVQSDCGYRRYVAVQALSLTDLTRSAGTNTIRYNGRSHCTSTKPRSANRHTPKERSKLDGFPVLASDTTRGATLSKQPPADPGTGPPKAVVDKTSVGQRHLGARVDVSKISVKTPENVKRDTRACSTYRTTHSATASKSPVQCAATCYRLLELFVMLLRAFLSFPSVCPASSAFRFVPADAALVFTDTSVDLPAASPDAIFATCASAALQSAAESFIAYLRGE
ncbi:hypothetical protein C8Q73DRAFT_145493 [Cubamyces lactineus]|nr:hypothetical protein C8Q73DRAFT_145493 [Cubamyces lactineus]